MKANGDLDTDTWNQCTYTKSPEYSALVGYVHGGNACCSARARARGPGSTA